LLNSRLGLPDPVDGRDKGVLKHIGAHGTAIAAQSLHQPAV
jgi:hypothetical protein